MADTYLPAEPLSEGDDGDEVDVDPAALRYVEASDRLEVGARILRVFAYFSAGVWAVVVVCATWFYWDQFDTKADSSSGGAYLSQIVQANNHRVPQTVITVAGATWPYLAVAVIAYGAALLVDGRRLAGLLDAVIDDDDA